MDGIEENSVQERLDLVKNAIAAVYDTAVNNERRLEATKMIEGIKELAPAEVEQIAYALISQKDLILARTGYNFLENIIKYKWLEISMQSRLTLRTCCFDEMKSESMLQRELRCAAARCVVAMIEHEWPQNWPELFDQLEEVGSVSITHAQLPFIILQLLIEDVVTLLTVESFCRRKDLNNAITSNMSRILRTIHFTLRECSLKATDESYALVRSALELFSELAEWVPARVFEPHINDLLCVICSFLETSQHSIYEMAANCLWRIALRKQAKHDENLIVLALFGDVPMKSILTAANAAASVGADIVEHYRFLKTLCNVLSALGIHFAEVWSRRPPNFAMYLAAIEAFFTHPSISLRNEAVAVFASLINQEQIRDDELFDESICRVIAATPNLLEKVGYPSKNDCETCRFSQHDYDDDEDFSHDFTKFRDRCLKVIRSACTEKHVKLLISIVEDWVRNRCFSCPNSVRETEWDAMQRFSKLVLSECYNAKLLQRNDYERLCVLLDGILSLMRDCSSPPLMNNLLSMLSALLVIIGNRPQLLVPLLSELRRLFNNNVDDDDIDEKSVKRHCIALLLRLVTNFADDIKAEAEAVLDFCLSLRPNLSLMQQAACMQVVAALSNLCVDFTTQSNFLASALSNPVDYLLQTEIQKRLKSMYDPKNVNVVHVSYGTSSVFEITANERQQLLISIDPCAPSTARNLSDGPETHGRAFFCDITEKAQTLIGQFATKAAVQLFSDPQIGAWASSLSSHLDLVPDFRFRYWLRRTWKPFLCSCPEAAYQNVRQIFLSVLEELRKRLEARWEQLAAFERSEDEEPSQEQLLAEHMACILTRECVALLRELFGTLDSGEKIEEASCAKVYLLKDEVCCSSICQPVNVLFVNILPWELYLKIYGIEDDITVLDKAMEKFVALTFLCLTCRDTTAAMRVIPVCKSTTESLAEECGEQLAVFMFVRSIQSLQIHGSDELALTALLSLIFHIYSSLRRRFPNLARVLQQVPECSAEDVERLDNRIASMERSADGANEKVKREIMKKLLRPVIATTVGEQHRRPVHLRPLPPLPRKNNELAEEDFIALGLIFSET